MRGRVRRDQGQGKNGGKGNSMSRDKFLTISIDRYKRIVLFNAKYYFDQH